MSRRIAINIIILLLSVICIGTSEAQLDKKIYHQIIINEISFFRDESQQLTLNEVLKRQKEEFKNIQNGLHLGHTSDAIWIKLKLKKYGDNNEQWLIELTNGGFEDVQFFNPNTPNTPNTTPLQAGTKFPFTERKLKNARPLFPIVLNNNTQEFYIRIHTDTSITTQLKLTSAEERFGEAETDFLAYGALAGGGLLSILLGLMTWSWSRNPIAIYFNVSTIAFVFTVLARLGIITQYIIIDNVFWSRHIGIFATGIFFATLFFALMKFYEIHKISKVLVYSIWAIIGANFIVFFIREAGHFRDWGSSIYYLSWAIGLLIINFCIFYRWLVNNINDLASLVMFPTFSIGLIYTSFVSLGWISGHPEHQVVWMIGGFGYTILTQLYVSQEARMGLIRIKESEQKARIAEHLATSETKWRKQQAQFFAVIAHELRPPLGAVRIGLENLARTCTNISASVDSRISRLKIATATMSEIIERHLQLQRILQSDFPTNFSNASATSIIDRPEMLFRELFPNRHLRIRHSESTVTLNVDIELAQMALLNLLTNAGKYSPPNSIIVLTATPLSDRFRFTVTDSGPGLSIEQQNAGFEAFWNRGSTNHSNDALPSNLGIGLSFVNNIMRLHGGRLVYERKDELTRFSIEFHLQKK